MKEDNSTIYEKVTRVKKQFEASKDTDKEQFKKRVAASMAALVGGTAIGGGMAYAAKHFQFDSDADTEGKAEHTNSHEESAPKAAAQEKVVPEVESKQVTEEKTQYTIGEEHEQEVNGIRAHWAEGVYNGKEGIFVDTTGDGKYDKFWEDADHDGSPSDNEIIDISNDNIPVVNPVIETPPTPVSDEYTVDTSSEQIAEIEGEQVIVATGTHNGNPAIFIDVNRDGVYDAYIDHDANGDGDIDLNDVEMITSTVHVSNHDLVDGSPSVRYATYQDDDMSIVVDHSSERVIDGEEGPMVVANAMINGHQAVVVDLNSDGSYDAALVEGEDHPVNIVSASIEVQHSEFVDNGLIDANYASNESTTDYVNSLSAESEEQTVEVEVDAASEQTVEVEISDGGQLMAEATVEIPEDTPETMVEDDSLADSYNELAFNDPTESSVDVEDVSSYETL